MLVLEEVDLIQPTSQEAHNIIAVLREHPNIEHIVTVVSEVSEGRCLPVARKYKITSLTQQGALKVPEGVQLILPMFSCQLDRPFIDSRGMLHWAGGADPLLGEAYRRCCVTEERLGRLTPDELVTEQRLYDER